MSVSLSWTFVSTSASFPGCLFTNIYTDSTIYGLHSLIWLSCPAALAASPAAPYRFQNFFAFQLLPSLLFLIIFGSIFSEADASAGL